ncbi:MAG TPA: pentapeptide repeat-containing protein [Xanthobacteraceae bacterium]|nr:pentapeptide repeat-containing protein [Xanthobacteraceae bacterium]
MDKKELVIDGITYIPKETETETKTVGVQIKNRWTGSIIFQSTKITMKEAVLEAVEQANKNGTRANLTRANLTGANLTDANLTGADLTGATLYLGWSLQNFPAFCKAIKTIRWNGKTGADFTK